MHGNTTGMGQQTLPPVGGFSGGGSRSINSSASGNSSAQALQHASAGHGHSTTSPAYSGTTGRMGASIGHSNYSNRIGITNAGGSFMASRGQMPKPGGIAGARPVRGGIRG